MLNLKNILKIKKTLNFYEGKLRLFNELFFLMYIYAKMVKCA